jgi:hypothetical protein
VATTDRIAPARPGLGDREPGHARPGGRRAGWWRGWFTPAKGLRPRPLDVLVALVIAFVQVAGTIGYSQDEPPSPWAFDAAACVPLLAGPVALLFRRRWPEATLVVTFAAAAGYAASGYPRGPAGFPAFGFAVVSAIMMGRSSFAWRVLAVAYAAFIWLPSLVPDEVEKARGLAGAATNLVWLPLVGAASEIARSRLERRAERAHVAREEARRRASEERLLIARELHDVLAHNISLINVQSGVALHLLDERPEQARPALEAINEASEEALEELHSVLEVLSRGLGEDGAHGESGRGLPTSPRPACATWTAWCDGPGRPAWTSTWPSRERPGRCPLGSTWRRCGSCRRRSPTSSATPAATPGPRSAWCTPPPSWSCRSTTMETAWRRPTADRRQAPTGRMAGRAVASPACGSGSTLWAARSQPAPAPAGASASGRSSRCGTGRDDQRLARRRPGPGAGGLPGAARRPGRRRGGGRGR